MGMKMVPVPLVDWGTLTLSSDRFDDGIVMRATVDTCLGFVAENGPIPLMDHRPVSGQAVAKRAVPTMPRVKRPPLEM